MEKRGILKAFFSITAAMCWCAPTVNAENTLPPQPEAIAKSPIEDATSPSWHQAPFLNQHGVEVRFEDLLAKPTVLSFVFTQCRMYCPAQGVSLAQLQKDLHTKYGNSSYQFVSVSLSPEHDTPETMLRFSQRFSLDYTNWHFLIGSQSATQSLIQKTGLTLKNYSKDGRADFDHSTEVYIVNSKAEIIQKIRGLPLDKERIIEALDLSNKNHMAQRP